VISAQSARTPFSPPQTSRSGASMHPRSACTWNLFAIDGYRYHTMPCHLLRPLKSLRRSLLSPLPLPQWALHCPPSPVMRGERLLLLPPYSRVSC